jgi:hypothetical protein
VLSWYCFQIFIIIIIIIIIIMVMLSAGTLISLEDIMFPLNTFYCKQDTVCMLSIYFLVCIHNFSFIIIIISFFYFINVLCYY